ncbi:MAG TPA: diguanylate cyclase [Burkholderiales bacterium]|jgi:diguanylate cyclase (GGDEF)-like protein/PAS domain S-box-containing protein
MPTRRKRTGVGRIRGHLSPDWYWEQDTEHRFTKLDLREDADAAERKRAAKLIGKRRWESGLGTDTDWDAHRALLEAHKPFRDLLVWRDLPDGTRRWILTSGEPVFDARRRFKGYRGIGRNVTEQKDAEARLRASESRLRAIVDNEPECVKVMDAEGNLLDMNPAGLRMIEADILDQLRGQCVYPLIAEEHRDAYCELVRAVAAGAERSLEFEVIGLKGTRRWLETRSVPLRDEASGATLVLSLTRDITRRKQAEAQIRESEARFRALTELSSDWYWEQDAEYRFTRLEGRHPQSIDRDLAQRLMGQTRWSEDLACEGGWRAHRALLERREPFYNLLMWRKARNGGLRYVRVSGEPVLDAGGRLAGYRGVGREVTDEKRAEIMLRLEHDVAHALAACERSEEGIRTVLRAVCEAENLPCGRYFALDEAAQVLRFQQAWHVADPDIERFVEDSRELTYKPDQGFVGATWKNGEALWSTDPQSDPRGYPRALGAAAGIQSVFAFPALADGHTLAVLVFTGKEPRAPDERLLQSARVIGSQVGRFLRSRQVEVSLRESEARFRSLTQMSTDFYWETDAEHRVLAVSHNPTYRPTEKIIGRRRWEVPYIGTEEIWTAHRARLDAHQPFRDFEFARPVADGSVRYLSISGDPRLADDGRFLGYRGVGRDVTEIALARERIASLAYSDPLTGLANRTSLGPALEQAVQRSRRRGSKLALIFLDLDGFKPINDVHGHAAGDSLLIEVAARLRAHLRAGDMVARLGGDEFVVVLEELQDLTPVETVSKKLLGEMRRPFDLPGEQVGVTASIGISVFPDDAADAAALIKHADIAMYTAKEGGKDRLAFYTSGPAANEPTQSRKYDSA